MTHYLIDFKDDASDEDIQEYLISYHCTVLGKFDNLNKVYHVEASTEPPSFESIVELVQNDDETAINLLEIKPLYNFMTSTESTTTVHSDEKNWWKVYSIENIDLSTDSSTVPVFGESIDVYVVDSGIDISHEEFVGKDITLLHSIIPNDFNDYTGHGTALSSVILGNTCGITNCSIKVVKVLNDEGTPTKHSDLLYAFDAIINSIGESGANLSVINISWAIPKNTYVENKIKHLLTAGAAVVVAAGNSGVPIENVTPASMPNVITVGAYQEDFMPCDFSDYTDPGITSLTSNVVNSGALDIWAPGNKIYAAKAGGGYGFVSGTSIAAAIQSASIAYYVGQLQQQHANMLDIYSNPDNGMFIPAMVNFGRAGLLDLSDSKYSSSVNAITTFRNWENYNKSMTSYINGNFDQLQKPQSFVQVTNQPEAFYFAKPLARAYELKSPLPEGVSINGHLIHMNMKTEPASDHDTYEIPVTFYPADESLSPIETTFTIVHLPSTFDATLLTADDPILKLMSFTTCYQQLVRECVTSCGKYRLPCDTAAGSKSCWCPPIPPQYFTYFFNTF